MSEDNNPYKAAYERERQARKIAEALLDEKTRSLYDSVVELKDTVVELQETQDKLVQSEKMASIGQLAAGIAHEINNPIGFTLSNLNTLTDYLDAIMSLDKWVCSHLDRTDIQAFSTQYQALRKEQDIEFVKEDINELLADSLKGLNRVSAIVANLKKVSHSGELEKEACDINELIDESLKVVWSELKYTMDIRKHYGELPLYECHGGEITQVLMNLFLNASYACEQNGALDITTKTAELNKQLWLIIEVRDNGKGMPKEILKKIFDPFFTTKPVGVGTGLGLSVSFGIIEKHGGTIKVQSVEGQGTTFIIALPCEMANSSIV